MGVQGVYQREFERCFRARWKVSTQTHLFQKIAKSRILYLGDFHALRQSQKGHQRILSRLKPDQVVLALECVESQHQKWVQSFVQGKLSEKEFLKKVQWNERWGFPWENYRGFFEWAKEHKVPVVALNQHSDDLSQASLLARDRHAAQVIVNAWSEHPQKKWVVIFGEQHLAPGHLPKEVSRQLNHPNSTLVFQNNDQIFFNLMEKSQDAESDLVELKNGVFVVLNIPPWVKWQDYLLYLERTSDLEWGDTSLELSDDVGQLVRLLAQDLGLPRIDKTPEIYTSLDETFWKWLQKKLTSSEKLWVKSLIESGVSFYLPHHSVGYLARLSVNHASQLATAILHSEKSGQQSLEIDFPTDFYAQIWREAFQYFGSKLLNPRRKTDTLVDLKAALVDSQRVGMDIEPVRLALAQKMREHLFLTTGRKPPLRYSVRRKRSYFLAARLMGGMLGEKFYSGFRNNTKTVTLLKKWMEVKTHSPNFEAFYFEALEVVESWPEHFQSKAERL